ncbi:hypothetical protein H4R18_001463 [Coemansia javaensis]|uniref:Magnesium transporter n=1 Tax=Coemansia javaensis TaxID=2761396 RepID=A0A9W8HKJ4_9FUNG|nr:hypothetical protein H4R18_001463 [Coemansia javaensis]
MHGRALVGVAASVAGSVGHSLGMTLQKRAHVRAVARRGLELELGGQRGRRRQQHVWRERQWQAGLVLYLGSSTVPPAVALSILPVFVAAPLAAVGLVANAGFAWWLLGSRFTGADAMGTLMVAAGCACVAVFGAIDEPLLSLAELLRLFRRPLYVAFSALFWLAVAALVAAELRWRRRYARLAHLAAGAQPSSPPATATAAAASSPAVPLAAVHCADETEPLLPPSPSSCAAGAKGQPQEQPDAGAIYRAYVLSAGEEALGCELKAGRGAQAARGVSGMLSAVVSGLICSQTLVLAKSGVGLVALAVRGDMQLGDPLAAAIVAGLVLTATANLYYIQRALSLCSTLTVVPLSFCSSSLAALLTSLVYFDQLRLLTPLQLAMIAAGTVMLGLGVLLLSLKGDRLQQAHLDQD